MLIDPTIFDELDILEFIENKEELINNFDFCLNLIREEKDNNYI
jgi:hypothetical protein